MIFSIIVLPAYVLSRVFRLFICEPVRFSYREHYYAHERLLVDRLAGCNVSWHVERVRAGSDTTAITLLDKHGGLHFR